MNFNTAKQAVDFYYEHCKNVDIASISFYGGEPLLEFELVKRVVEYCEKKFNKSNHFWVGYSYGRYGTRNEKN